MVQHVDLTHIQLEDGPSAEPVRCTMYGIQIYRRHPVVARALGASPKDPVGLMFLVSALYTAVNIFLEEITDDHEKVFQHLLASAAASELT